jgi:hypothetical protein
MHRPWPAPWSGLVDRASAALSFQRREEVLHRRVVPALTAPAHPEDDVLALQQPLEIVAGVLAALVRMVHQRSRFPSSLQGHQQRIAHHLSLHDVVH